MCSKTGVAYYPDIAIAEVEFNRRYEQIKPPVSPWFSPVDDPRYMHIVVAVRCESCGCQLKVSKSVPSDVVFDDFQGAKRDALEPGGHSCRSRADVDNLLAVVFN